VARVLIQVWVQHSSSTPGRPCRRRCCRTVRPGVSAAARAGAGRGRGGPNWSCNHRSPVPPAPPPESPQALDLLGPRSRRLPVGQPHGHPLHRDHHGTTATAPHPHPARPGPWHAPASSHAMSGRPLRRLGDQRTSWSGGATPGCVSRL